MITETEVTAAALASAVAANVAQALAPGTPLNVGQPLAAPVDLPFRYAVVAPLGGLVSGELALFVDDVFAESLLTSPVGQLDLADALAPALAASAAVLGSIVPGAAQTVDARVAVHRIDAHQDSVVVGLDDGVDVRGAVAVGLHVVAAPVGYPPVEDRPISAAGQAERLDLLRGVEMAATVELGRARMTVNDLLSLRDGAIVELDRAAGDAADLFVNGRLIARGEVVVVDENYGLRLTQIVTDETGR